MKKIIFIIMSLLLVSSVSALSIGKVRYFEDIFLVNVYNNEVEDLEDLKVRVMVMNDDIKDYKAKSFDLDSNEKKGTYVIIDEPITKGIVKVIVMNDDVRRVKYYII